MEYFPAPLEKLVEQFAKLPGVGYKSAQRLAFHVLSLPAEEAQTFADAITDAKRSVTLCPVCQNLTAGGLCPICADAKRDDATICVVADPRDVIAIERSREYRGRYHVLHGVLSPMNHVGPDDLHIKSLLDRVAQGGVEEVIMATNPDTGLQPVDLPGGGGQCLVGVVTVGGKGHVGVHGEQGYLLRLLCAAGGECQRRQAGQQQAGKAFHSSRRPSSARISVASSANSRWPPTGMP